jgi:hypothetical protein
MTQADNENPRSDDDNWEAAALRRIARRVENLPDSPPGEAEDFGWEEAVLENLRRRLAANE